MDKSWLLGGLLVVIGLAQIAGDLARQSVVKGVAAATGASPAPRIFSSVRGLETYSTKFFLEWTRRDGTTASVELTPEIYARMRGPYNRRNVYGAVLAYGPVLVSDEKTRPMFDAVARSALGGAAPLLTELGVDATDRVGPVRIRMVPREGTTITDMPMVLECPA